MYKKMLLCLALAVLSLSLALCACAAGETTLTILGTSDLHGNIWGFNYEDNAETANNGIARLYTYIQQVRAENPNTILLDNGDAIQGTIMTDDLFNKYPEKAHPVMTVMNHMGYDAMTLGNHEFNWGIPAMNAILGQAEFPVLAANVRSADGAFVTGSGWTILEEAGIRVAVIGVVTPDVPIWDSDKEGVDEYTFEAANEAVQNAIEQIGEDADVIVVCAHMGMYPEYDEEYGSDSAQKILDDNPEIDVLLAGHMHSLVNEKQGDVPIGAPREGGRDIVRFDLTLNAEKDIIDATVQVIGAADFEPSEEIRALEAVAEAHEEAVSLVSGSDDDGGAGEVLGSTTAKFQPENEIAGIPAGRIMDTAVVDLINRIQLENAQADVSSAALFENTSDLPEGDITYRDILSVYKHSNTLYRVPVTGAELKAYMEWSARCYNQWKPGDINISFDPEYPAYLLDMFAGVEYEVDLSRPHGQRIKNVMFKGEPLQDDQVLTLAVNNYRYSSVLKPEGIISGRKEWESSSSIRDMLVEYFAEHSPVAPEVDNNWKIVGVDLQLDDPRRAEIIEKINSGEIDTPYAKSINLNDHE
ncbi:MAG: 5'-nucleotidase C-terminal domain-containing protein [Eubacteriales bacterium]|nr:5'-nucleotidase C-terminal domain-containing protein [Eubacteriales bacterium]